MAIHRSQRLAAISLAVVGTVSVLLGAPILVHAAPPDEAPFRLVVAAEQGAFGTNPAAKATIGRVTDPSAGEVLKFDFVIPPAAAAGVWANVPPGRLAPGTADLVRLVVRAELPDGPQSVAAKVELKPKAGGPSLSIPLVLTTDWTPRTAAVDWPKVGEIGEVVVSVEPVGKRGPVTGSVFVDVRFDRLTPLQRLGTSPSARLVGVGLVAVTGAAVVAMLWAVLGWRGRNSPRSRPWAGVARDVVQGSGVVLIVGLVAGVYYLGGLERFEAGWSALWVAVGGVVVAGWLKLGLTGKPLTPGEVFRDLLVTGIPAASASPLPLLQAPGSWDETLVLSQTAAAAVVLAYHAANFCRLTAAGRHLGSVTAALVITTPYVVGALLLLRADALVRTLGSGLSIGAFADWPEVATHAGRAAVVFVFNVVVANGLGVAARRALLRSPAAYLSLFATAVAAVMAPWVAAIGSGETVALWPGVGRMLAEVVAAAVSQAGLWAEVYLITGLGADALRGRPPGRESAVAVPVQGAKKGAIFGGTFLAVVYVPGLLWEVQAVRDVAAHFPIVLITLAGVLAFPLLKTVIETFDGSSNFYRRVAASYRNPVLYARGAVTGLGLGYAAAAGMAHEELGTRVWFGIALGAAAFAGVDLVWDLALQRRGRGRMQPIKVYVVKALLGGFVGAAIGFYLDAAQVAVIGDKLRQYLTSNGKPDSFGVRPFMSKWGFIDLGPTTGGASLLFAESLSGVIEWSIPAWLFALNRTALEAYFRKEAGPIKALFTHGGLAGLTETMIAVFRWGLWMSPVIKSFLRQTGEPTWYNQDGAIRTLLAIFEDVTTSPDQFRAWSFQLFVSLLAYDGVRIAIWFDHMGLRVATLVNLSFMGVDRLDGRLARFLAPAASARCIPEAVKRFTTWAPLLIPFYIPRGADWDAAWSESQRLQAAAGDGLIAQFLQVPLAEQVALGLAAAALVTAIFTGVRLIRSRFGPPLPADHTLTNAAYEVTVSAVGAVVSHVPGRGYDVTRRAYDPMHPAGRAIFLVESGGSSPRSWPVVGNYPAELAVPSVISHDERAITIRNEANGLRTTVEITLPAMGDAAEVWTVTFENPGDTARTVGVVPYLEWVLNTPGGDRGHTQYNRLFAELEYDRDRNAVLAWDKHAKAAGILASDAAPDGFLTARVDFIGRARSLWASRVLETLAFRKADGVAPHPTLDPIGSLLVWRTVPPNGSAQIRFLVGLAETRQAAADLAARHLGLTGPNGQPAPERHPMPVARVGHGEIPPGTPQPYYSFPGDGRRMVVHTPFTPRPWDHAMANALGHTVTVTNRGLHTSCSWNSQQNRLTPDWPDTVVREVPGEAIYLYDPDANEWYSPTYHPLNDPRAVYEAEFGVDGTATFRMTRGPVETELVVFVPPDEPAGVYLLTVRNRSDVPRRIRVAPYFQMVLAEQPEAAGPLVVRHDTTLNALYFENPRNRFRPGPAFAAVSPPVERVETSRGRFFGAGRGVAHPVFVERAEPDATHADDRPIAAFLVTLDLPPRGERSVTVILGQANDSTRARATVRRYQTTEAARESLDATRRARLQLADTVRLQGGPTAFDHYPDWLKYQALVERLIARRGFYQASGAFGYRDQLQDAVNLLWANPDFARGQIVLHAAHQFREGDVAHWFHLLPDGRTGLVGRTYASDTLLWLPWAVVEYLAATGDESVLGEWAPDLEAEQPLAPLPAGKGGMGFEPLRSARGDSVYGHCRRAVDLVLGSRIGRHGLPLMLCGDWNDGLDEIGSEGKGESVWLGFFLLYVLDRWAGVVGRREGPDREAHYRDRHRRLKDALEATWRRDRYLRAYHDDGTEIGVGGSGIWEIDALTAAWAVLSDVDPDRSRIGFDTAVRLLEHESAILLGSPPLREDTKPYLGRSSWYPEGVRENGMYCHGVQWLVGAARVLGDRLARQGDAETARAYRETAYRLWLKVSPIPHTTPNAIETYGGQPNKQAADIVTTFDPGRMIWNGYTGAAGWMFRQALEGVLGYRLDRGGFAPTGPQPDELRAVTVTRSPAGPPTTGG